MSRAQKMATIWTLLLSVTFSILLFPVLLSDRGLSPALFFTSIGILFIWILYFTVGSFIDWAVREEIKEKERSRKNITQ